MSPLLRSRRSSAQVRTRMTHVSYHSISASHFPLWRIYCLCLHANGVLLKVFKVVRRPPRQMHSMGSRQGPMSSASAAYRPATLGHNGIRNNSSFTEYSQCFFCFWILFVTLFVLVFIVPFSLDVEQVNWWGVVVRNDKHQLF